MTMALQPAKIFTGRVTYADTGEPVPRARVQVSAASAGRGYRSIQFQTDADGRFRANPSPGDRFDVMVVAPPGQIYLGTRKRLEWPKGAVEQSIDVALPRGVAIRGTVVEEGSAQPVAGARVGFTARPRADVDYGIEIIKESVTAADGSFELAVAPRAGILAVLAPSEDYVRREIGNRALLQGQPGGRRQYSHGFLACDPKPSGPGLEVRVALHRGVTVTGCIVGPDDQPVQDAWIISRAVLQPSSSAWHTWIGSYHGEALNGRFELHGVDPDTDLAVYFLEPKRRLGATIHVLGKPATGGPMTVRLEPCGTAVARLVDASNRPLAGYRNEYLIAMIVTPGAQTGSRAPADAMRLLADEAFVARIDPINYANNPESDAQGRITFPALIPGASYRIYDTDSANRRLRKDFTVKPGETLDLGDIVIEKPRAR